MHLPSYLCLLLTLLCCIAPRPRAVPWEKAKEGLPIIHQKTKYVLPTQRKVPIGRNRCAYQSNLICSNYAINNFQIEC
jgi:hypothetical protein